MGQPLPFTVFLHIFRPHLLPSTFQGVVSCCLLSLFTTWQEGMVTKGKRAWELFPKPTRAARSLWGAAWHEPWPSGPLASLSYQNAAVCLKTPSPVPCPMLGSRSWAALPPPDNTRAAREEGEPLPYLPSARTSPECVSFFSFLFFFLAKYKLM